jgi:hypothetical protein
MQQVHDYRTISTVISTIKKDGRLPFPESCCRVTYTTNSVIQDPKLSMESSLLYQCTRIKIQPLSQLQIPLFSTNHQIKSLAKMIMAYCLWLKNFIQVINASGSWLQDCKHSNILCWKGGRLKFQRVVAGIYKQPIVSNRTHSSLWNPHGLTSAQELKFSL